MILEFLLVQNSLAGSNVPLQMSAEDDGWITIPPMLWQRRCIDAATRFLPTCPGVRAAWVGGSLARGEGDQFSDVDLNCLVSNDTLAFWRHHWSEVVARLVGPMAMARTINESIVGGFSLTGDWEHVDLIIHPLDSFARPVDCHVLYDPDGLIDHFSQATRSDNSMNAGDMSEFVFYLAGSFATLIGRGELILAQDAVVSLRQWLIRLMFAENRRRPIGGSRRLNDFLNAEQRQELQDAGVVMGSAVEATATAATMFYNFAVRARRLSVTDGSEFPELMFKVTERHLRRTLGELWPAGVRTDCGKP